MKGLSEAYPGSVLVGGLASGSDLPGENQLILREKVIRDGFVAVALTGNVVVETVVAQGCRPIGQPMFVTGLEGDRILELDGRVPVEVLNELFEAASASEQRLFQHSLFMGLQMDSQEVESVAGDFLVRNFVAADPVNGALVVSAALEENQVVQFHLRDGQSASDELDDELQAYAKRTDSVDGALLFSCLGRGRGLYGVANHDCDALRRHMGDVPVAGFFGNGEIGPIEGRPFLHGYTSVFVFFRAANP